MSIYPTLSIQFLMELCSLIGTSTTYPTRGWMNTDKKRYVSNMYSKRYVHCSFIQILVGCMHLSRITISFPMLLGHGTLPLQILLCKDVVKRLSLSLKRGDDRNVYGKYFSPYPMISVVHSNGLKNGTRIMYIIYLHRTDLVSYKIYLHTRIYQVYSILFHSIMMAMIIFIDGYF